MSKENNTIDESLFGGGTEIKSTPAEQPKNYALSISQQADVIDKGGAVVAVPAGSKAIIVRQEFNPEVQKRVDEIELELKNIKAISSQDDAAKANAVLKKAKSFQKTLKEERKFMTNVLDEEKSSLINYEERIVGSISALVDIINNRIVDFQKEELRKQAELDAIAKKKRDEELEAARKESDRKAGIQKKILDFENSVIKAAGDATIADIDEKIKKLAGTKVLAEAYMEFLPEAEIMYQGCVARLATRKTELLQLAELEKKNKELADQLKKEQEERAAAEALAHKEKAAETMQNIESERQMDVANSQMNYEVKVSSKEKIKGVQKRWVFDPAAVDMALLPEEYKTFDAAKIKEAISLGARDIPGLKIYQEVSNVSR